MPQIIAGLSAAATPLQVQTTRTGRFRNIRHFHAPPKASGADAPIASILRAAIGKLKMPSVDTAVIVLAGIALFAAFVNGAIGYGFSSLTVPVALVFYTNRVLNPAVVVVEVFINLYVLFINLDGVPSVWKRVFPILIGMLPGIAAGALVLTSLQPDGIKFATYTTILPFILLQAAGWRRPMADGFALWNGAGDPVLS